MSNLSNNRINITVTPEELRAVKDAFETIATKLSFLIGLTTEERKQLTSMDVSNKAFTEDAINAGINNSTLIPSYISINNMQNDMALFTQLDEIHTIANQLCERIEDTKMLAGSEAYKSALTLYKAFGTAADAGAPGAGTIVKQLGKRFAGNPHGNKAVPVAEPPIQ